jgi:uncharacterized DUF497 family protein
MDWNDEFEWDENNEDKIAEKHQVDRYEAEQAARDPNRWFSREGEDRHGNPRYHGIGKTIDGRILFFIVDRKGSRLWRIGSCKDAQLPEKRYYRKKTQ